MIRQQRTLARELVYEGIGLHTGNAVHMRFLPAPPNTGIVFRRIDLTPPVEIPVHVDFSPAVSEEFRNTTLTRNGQSIHTVEHVLATLTGLGVDNVVVELDSNEPAEPPLGSCEDYVRRIKETGIVGQGAPVRYFEVKQPISLVENEIELLALPYDGFRISFTIKYDEPVLGTQYASFDINPQTFEEELATARTFVLWDDVERLRAQGLIKGGTMDNAIVVGPQGILNEAPLRFPNEFVRHKILDLIGDMALMGMPFIGHVKGERSGHALHTKLVAEILRRPECWVMLSTGEKASTAEHQVPAHQSFTPASTIASAA